VEQVPHIVGRVVNDFCPKISNIARMLEQVIDFEGDGMLFKCSERNILFGFFDTMLLMDRLIEVQV
jgi:hypothetical protein